MSTQRREPARPGRKKIFGAAVSLAALGLAAACGGSSSGGGGGSTGGGSGSGASASVPIILVAPLTGSNGAYTPWVNAVKAAVDAVNAGGGAGGHKIDLSVCDAGESANTELACGQQAVDDHVVGMIDMMDLLQPLTKFTDPAGIPRFGFMVDPVDATDKLSYSTAYPTGGDAQFAKNLKCTKLVLVREDPGSPSEVTQYTNSFIQKVQSKGITASAVQVPTNVTSGATYIAKAIADHPDCIDVQGFGAPMVDLMQAAGQLVPKSIQLLSDPSFISIAGVKSLGTVLNRVLVPDFAWPISSASGHPGLQQFKSEIQQYAPKPNALDNNSEDMWANTHALLTAIGDVKGTVTGAKVVAALNTFNNYDTKIGPPVSFDIAPASPAPPRVFAPYALAEKYVNGSPVAVGGFFNIYTGASVPTSD